MIKDKNQKWIEKEKQGEEGEESELQKSFDLKVIKTLYLLNAEDVVKTCCGRGKNVLGTART